MWSRLWVASRIQLTKLSKMPETQEHSLLLWRDENQTQRIYQQLHHPFLRGCGDLSILSVLHIWKCFPYPSVFSPQTKQQQQQQIFFIFPYFWSFLLLCCCPLDGFPPSLPQNYWNWAQYFCWNPTVAEGRRICITYTYTSYPLWCLLSFWNSIIIDWG